jgi:hypothetical protein
VRVVFCCPTTKRPHDAFLAAMEQSVAALDAAGFDHRIVWEIGNPYISAARATMTRKALDAQADVIVYLDHDVSWRPQDLVTLVNTPGDVVAGVYRYKRDEEEYMGALFSDERGQPLGRQDGCLAAHRVPAGFLKITKEAVNRFMEAYPDLVYGPYYYPSVDLFNHGSHGRLWYGEDYAFSRRWLDAGGEMWIVPDLSIAHHDPDKAYPGNFHEFLSGLPKLPSPKQATLAEIGRRWQNS